MPRKKSEQVEEVETQEVEPQEVEAPKAETQEVEPAKDPKESLVEKIKEKVEEFNKKNPDHLLRVEYNPKLNGYIRISGHNGLYCFARVSSEMEEFGAEYLSFIPSNLLAELKDMLSACGVGKVVGVFNSPSGI
jgi:hypothetical protein